MRPLALALTLLLAACAAPPVARVSAQEAGDPSDTRVAKHLFGAAPVASSEAAEPIGFYSRGCQAGAVQLPETGPTWQAMRLSRNRNWAQPGTVAFVQDLSRFAATLPGWNGLYVGDMSQPRGGPMTSGHASHQTGLDIDVWLRPADRLNLTVQEREDLSSLDMQRAEGAYVNDRWTPAHEALVRQAAMDPRVERIFIFAGAKIAMCENATGDRSWLSKVRPYWGHNTHFHIRLRCPAGAANCTGQDPVPAGDGCAEALEWRRNILNPPPPDPNARPAEPRRDLTMADLPGQCARVLRAS
jgi:penicillin-insensitive murein endopeptidase